jgi:hypothetical protein
MGIKDTTKTARFESDYSPGTFLRVTQTMDSDIIISIFGDGEFRISTSGGKLHEHKLVNVVRLFSKIIDTLNDSEEENNVAD